MRNLNFPHHLKVSLLLTLDLPLLSLFIQFLNLGIRSEELRFVDLCYLQAFYTEETPEFHLNCQKQSYFPLKRAFLLV
jgi:hypothetical protein